MSAPSPFFGDGLLSTFHCNHYTPPQKGDAHWLAEVDEHAARLLACTEAGLMGRWHWNFNRIPAGMQNEARLREAALAKARGEGRAS